MAFRFADSFDSYVTADITQKWTSVGSQVSISSGSGRRSTSSLRVGGGSSEVTKTFDSQGTWVVGFSAKPAVTPAIDGVMLAFTDGGTAQVDIRIRTDGTLRATRNGTTLATSSNALSAGVTYFIECKVVISDTVGVIEVRVNGSSTGWINITGQDTKNATNATANVVKLGSFSPSSGSVAFDFDDVYICDGTGSVNNDFLGDVRVDSRLPSGNGNSSQLVGSDSNSTDNYLLVDETAQNGDTDYVASATVGNKDTYAFDDITHTPTSIFAVQINGVIKKDDAGMRSVCLVTRSGGSDTDGTTYALGTSYSVYREVRETDPNTSAAWTKTNLNNAEFGLKVAA